MLVKLHKESSSWSLLLVFASVSPAIVLSIILSSRHPSTRSSNQQTLHCQLYNNDGAGSTRACLAQWCANEAHWPYAWCNMTTLPFDPQYNKQFLDSAFPYDPSSSLLAWIAFGLVAGCLAAEIFLGVLQLINPTLKHDKAPTLSRRYRILVFLLTSIGWLLLVAACGVLLHGAIKAAGEWGLYNLPISQWTASAILLGAVLLVHPFQRILTLCSSKYIKTARTSKTVIPVDMHEQMPEVLREISPNSLPVRVSSNVQLSKAPSGLRRGSSDGDPSGRLASSAVEFSWRDIAQATQNFDQSMVLGEGGFGKVYKGILDNGSTVAVKVMNTQDVTGASPGDIVAEVEIINRVHHRNLVQLLGYCSLNNRLALVLEFMENGSLADLLRDERRSSLDWGMRLHIAIGAARGLSYLHNDCSPRVVHRDVKASNILLDSKFNAKVADFGLARLLGEEHNHATTRVMGTIGYLAPDYAFSGRLTDKSDVYSFGVVLLELLTGRKPVDFERSGIQQSLVEWVWEVDALGQDVLCIIDSTLDGKFHSDEVLQVWEVAVSCVNPHANYRPRMDEVYKRLCDCKLRGSLPLASTGKLSPVKEHGPGRSASCSIDNTTSDFSQNLELPAPVEAWSNPTSRQSSLGKIFSQLLTAASDAISDSPPIDTRTSDYLGSGHRVHPEEQQAILIGTFENDSGPLSMTPIEASGVGLTSHPSPEYWNEQLRHLRHSRGR